VANRMSPSLDLVRGKTVLVTGAAGTIGSALSEVLLPVVGSLRCLDHSETELFLLHQRLAGRGAMSPQLGDIRDIDRLRFAMSGVDVVFHAAALKHVGLGEYNPFEVVQTNLQGLNNVIRAALDANVERVIFTSSDKAVNPTNVMGASKMMGERLITAANEIRGARRTRFASVRFGNVIGSRGSVVPIFARQLLRKEPVTITDDNMTRYIMTIPEAAELVIEAGARAHGGEVFVTKMHAVRITDLAQAMADILSNGKWERVRVGARPGEKQYEELLSEDERPRAVDIDRLLIVLPSSDTDFAGRPTRDSYPDAKPVDHEWHSAKSAFMTRGEIVDYLRERGILRPFMEPGGFA
jgi:UDP-N-acetylglucosamine 4,6-dehydratase/5-epimerase